MSTFVASDLDPASARAWSRLFLAGVLSFALHFFLLTEVPVNPGGGAPTAVAVISARLEPAVADAPAVSIVESQPASDANPEKSALTDPLPDPAKATDTRQQEPKPAAAASAAAPSAGIEIPMIRDPTYYAAKQLDVYPKVVEINEPKCTLAAVSDRVNGKLLILALIDEFGAVNEVSVVEAEPEGYMEGVTLDSFRAARFSPAQRQGRNVKSRAPIRVVFDCTDKTIP